MKIIYFEIFGKRLQKKIDEKALELYSDAQIEYWLRGKLKVDKIEDVPDDDILKSLQDIFGMK